MSNNTNLSTINLEQEEIKIKAKQPTTNKQTYSQVKQLGEGSYGKAYLVKCNNDNSQAVIKTLNLESLSEEAKKEAFKEAKILEKLDHPNIIKFIEVFRSNKPFPTLNIVMEYADGGDLNKLIKMKQKEGCFFTEDQILDWFCQICLAVKHMHDKKILHRDLKSGNMFLMKSSMIKIGDFGISKSLDNTMDKAKTLIGTPYYLSPEIIMNKPYSYASDIWSLGVLLYELASLKMPFESKSMPMLTIKIIKGEYTSLPDTICKEIRDLVTSILVVDPKKRPTIDQLLKTSILRKRIKTFLDEMHYDPQYSENIIRNYVSINENN